jgi:hypothetical protein
MIKALPCCLTLLAIAIGEPAEAQPPASGAQLMEQYDVGLSGSDYREVPAGVAKLPRLAGSSGLTAIETWVSSQFDLPAIHEHPRIEFVLPAKITSLRFTGLLSDPRAQVAPNDRASSGQHDTVAVYYDATRTIYLPEGWTGGSRPSYPCSFMSWFITFKTCSGSNTSAHRSVRSLPIPLRTAGSLCLDTV